jgi:CheY-like chemotaxis protein
MRTLLVVDDEYSRWAPKEGLKDGYRTDRRVRRRLWILASEEVDAVITDIRMPVRSGVELVKHLRATRPGIKVFVISAAGSDDDARRCYECDVEAVLRKPLEIPVIRRMVELHLECAVPAPAE